MIQSWYNKVEYTVQKKITICIIEGADPLWDYEWATYGGIVSISGFKQSVTKSIDVPNRQKIVFVEHYT